ncbi:MAG TPA: CBS domain-containing protein, partial [Pirellulales bacterium]|nr:CBS domain-containing protein [Pirellulales bacterium]
KDIVSTLRLSPDQPSLRGITRSIPSVADDLSIASALQRMTRGHVHIALVRDRDQNVVGMVTLEDILEELIGDIQDEYDRSPAHVISSGVGWVMGGGVSLDRLEQETGVFLDRRSLPAACRTLDDWVRYKLDRQPRGGDIVRAAGLRVLVRKVRRSKVLEAQVARDESFSPAPLDATQAVANPQSASAPSSSGGGST